MQNKKNLFKILICLFVNALMCHSIVFGKVIEISSSKTLSIVNYIVVDSYYDEQIFTKVMALKVKNKGEKCLYNVKASIRSAGNNVIIEDREVLLGKILSDETVLSLDNFIVSIDQSKQAVSSIGFIWKIEYDDEGGKHWINENLVIEKLE